MGNGGKVNGIEVLSQWLCGRVPLAFFVSRIRVVADRLGLKGRIFMYVSKTFSVNNVYTPLVCRVM